MVAQDPYASSAGELYSLLLGNGNNSFGATQEHCPLFPAGLTGSAGDRSGFQS